MSSLRIIISGGGTGGHIFPAVAIANALKEKDPSTEILFVGAEGKMEMEKVPQAGYEIVGLPIRGIQRKFSLSNLKVPFLLLRSLSIAKKTIKKFNPDVVIGVGGYASAAVVYKASKMGRKTLIQEQNSYPGVTNKILGKRVDKICTAFDGMDRFFPKEKILLLGNPIRQDIIEGQGRKEEGQRYFGLDSTKKTILAIGGSLGARTINNCVMNLFPLTKSHNIQILWQCGSYYHENMKKHMAEEHNSNVHLHKFITEMSLAYAASDLVISRAGALSVSEIATLRKTAILIPSPNVAEDHQTKNARALSDTGAAMLLEDSKAADLIAGEVQILLESDNAENEIQENLKEVFSNANAAADIASEIIKLAGK